MTTFTKEYELECLHCRKPSKISTSFTEIAANTEIRWLCSLCDTHNVDLVTTGLYDDQDIQDFDKKLEEIEERLNLKIDEMSKRLDKRLDVMFDKLFEEIANGEPFVAGSIKPHDAFPVPDVNLEDRDDWNVIWAAPANNAHQ